MIQGAAFRVLACFYEQDTCSFVDMCERAGYPTDLGGYYIRQLVTGGYVQKVDRGSYAISPKGKQQLAFHYGKHFFAPRPRLAVALVAKQSAQYVVLRRKAQPFIGRAEWPAGAVNAGEPLQDAARRIALDRLGIEPELRLHGFFRRIDMYDDTVFDDKLFAVHTCMLPEDARVNPTATTGEIGLYVESALENIEKPARALLDILAYARRDNPAFEERMYALSIEDLQA